MALQVRLSALRQCRVRRSGTTAGGVPPSCSLQGILGDAITNLIHSFIRNCVLSTCIA